MSSTDAGTPARGDGRPPAEPAPGRGLRDRALGRVALLVLVLIAAFFVARSCGSSRGEITQDEAIEIAKDQASFEPCEQRVCVQVRYGQEGIPVRGFWGVVLSEKLDAEGRPTRTETFKVDIHTGEVARA